jgi:hypothetical protein
MEHEIHEQHDDGSVDIYPAKAAKEHKPKRGGTVVKVIELESGKALLDVNATKKGGR